MPLRSVVIAAARRPPIGSPERVNVNGGAGLCIGGGMGIAMAVKRV